MHLNTRHTRNTVDGQNPAALRTWFTHVCPTIHRGFSWFIRLSCCEMILPIHSMCSFNPTPKKGGTLKTTRHARFMIEAKQNTTGPPSDALLKVQMLVGYMKTRTKPAKSRRGQGTAWPGATKTNGTPPNSEPFGTPKPKAQNGHPPSWCWPRRGRRTSR